MIRAIVCESINQTLRYDMTCQSIVLTIKYIYNAFFFLGNL